MNGPVDILGQIPSLQIYTQTCFCYNLPSSSSHDHIINTLTRGLERLAASFPWIAGQIIKKGFSDNGNTGIFEIAPLNPTPRLVVKDFTHDISIPSMKEMKKAGFPMSMLDEGIFAPRNTILGTSGEEKTSVMEVFLVQLTFIRDGLILCFVGEHQVMDMTGQGQIIDLLDKACREERFTKQELSVGNLVRENIIPLFENSWEPDGELDAQISKLKTATEMETAQVPPPKSKWAYIDFTRRSLTTLKSIATSSLTSGFVSTDDVLTAFIYQCIVRARVPRLDSSKGAATLARAVDVRKFLSIPATYPGIIQNMVFYTNTIEDLISLPLGVIASQLRSKLDFETSTLAHRTRALATMLTRSEDKGKFNMVANLDFGVDLMLSSWAKMDFWGLDFGLGIGKAESVRRPQFVPVESLLYLMPKDRNGGIGVAVCLREEDMERLRDDGEMKEFGRYIG
jgi:hypothetical protein